MAKPYRSYNVNYSYRAIKSRFKSSSRLLSAKSTYRTESNRAENFL